jgi:hypothetical protein
LSADRLEHTDVRHLSSSSEKAVGSAALFAHRKPGALAGSKPLEG